METAKSISLNALQDKQVNDFLTSYDILSLPTPCHILFPENFYLNIMQMKRVFEEYNMKDNIFFSCKANKAITFLQLASKYDCGIEVSSEYELDEAIKYTSSIIASGPAKSMQYIQKAIMYKCVISVDDIEEIKCIAKQNANARIMLRIANLNDIRSRFGINKNEIKDCLNIISKNHMELIGFSFHINNYSVEDRIAAIKQVITLTSQLHIKIQWIDIGGGLPVQYCSKNNFDDFLKLNCPSMYFQNHYFTDFYPYGGTLSSSEALSRIIREVKPLLKDIQIVIEPGRSLLNNCGISVFSVYYRKRVDDDYVLVTDGNINFLSEQWFNSDYLIEPMLFKSQYKGCEEEYLASIAGNLCLEQDMLTWRKVKFEYTPCYGDKLVYFNTAGYQMDSNESSFHRIPIPPKYIAVKHCTYALIEDGKYDCFKNN